MKRKRLDLPDLPAKEDFWVDGSKERCEPTGFKVFDEGFWCNEFVDHNGEYHYAIICGR